ncbi:hypothetical protein [uncultured Shewanella sp.]|uniref:hypothetical protein n=1 Tax=uncultured Shewanella sp. TaxID=173975 RepID=UPI00262AF6AE|nr:hypothetical protein [uncultured Shewanella sp.]
MPLLLACYAGAGVGLLLGVIMGSSVTPTVATLLSVLTSLLGAMLGLNDGHFSAAKAMRLGSFGFACVLGAYLGIYVRSHNTLSPSLFELKSRYLAVGFNEQQAINLVHIKAFGTPLNTEHAVASVNQTVAAARTQKNQVDPEKQLSEPALKPSAAPVPASTASSAAMAPTTFAHQQHASLLFSASVQAQACDELMSTDDSLPLDEVMNNVELTGGQWEVLATNVRQHIASEHQKALLLLVKHLVCELPVPWRADEAMTETACLSLRRIQQTYHSDLWLTHLATQPLWQPITEHIQQQNVPTSVKSASLNYSSPLLCESVK